MDIKLIQIQGNSNFKYVLSANGAGVCLSAFGPNDGIAMIITQ